MYEAVRHIRALYLGNGLPLNLLREEERLGKINQPLTKFMYKSHKCIFNMAFNSHSNIYLPSYTMESHEDDGLNRTQRSSNRDFVMRE